MNVRPRFHTLLALVFALGAFLCLSVEGAHAQSGAGSIQGTVKDPSGAVIPGADVHVVNTATGVENDTTTNGTGFYQVPELFTGTYKITVTGPGMKTYETSIELLVSQNAVINPKMVAGAVAETVEVNADTVQLTTNDSAAIESTLENERLQELPENGRDVTNLIQLTTPGMVVNGVSQPALNGGDLGTLTYVIDGEAGTNNNRGGAFQPNATLIDPDAVQEVRVETSNASAQFATPGTAVLSTKSGTNHLHGSFFETARNNAFGVSRNRDDPQNTPKPQYIRNEFGLSAGGPVYIPKVYDGRNKTFWFFAYERYSLANQNSSRTAVPTLAMRHGDFSVFTTAKGVQQAIFDPATTTNSANCAYLTTANKKTTASPYCRTRFAYQGVTDTIDPARESPLAAIGFALYPLPTTNDNPNITGNLVGTVPQLQITPKTTFRVDQVFNQNNRIYIRYTQQANTIHTTGTTPLSLAVGDIPTGAVLGFKDAPNYSFNTAVGFTHIFSSTFSSETVVGGDWQDLVNTTGKSPNRPYEPELGLPNNFGNVGFPAIRMLIQNLAGSQAGNQHQTQRNFTLDENLIKIRGHHQILFGGRITHNSSDNKPATTPDISTWGKLPTGIYDPATTTSYGNFTNTGAADASFFLGSATTYTQSLSGPRETYTQWLGSLYAQDNFHVNSRLTLNLGVRYEAHPSLNIHNGLANSFDLKNDAIVLAGSIPDLIAKRYTTQPIIDNDKYIGVKFETPQEAGFPTGSLMKNYDLNFLPRIGFAYMLNSGTHSPVFRGGWGIYLYDTPQEDFANGGANNNPFQVTYTQDYTSAAQAIDGQPNELLRYNDPVVFGTAGNAANNNGVQNAVNTTFTTANPAILPGGAIYSVSPDWKPAKVQQVNLTLEIPMHDRSALRISYIGSKSTNLDINNSYNNSPSLYQWEVAKGMVQPKGTKAVIGTPQQNTYSATGWNPYDQTTYGANQFIEKLGWANFNSLQMNYQRLYHNGSAYQISYTWAKAMRAGGDLGGGGTGLVQPLSDYPGQNGNVGVVSLQPQQTPLTAGAPPPARPSGVAAYDTWHEMIRYQLYQQDSATPAHYIRFNGLYDFPIGRGKRFLSNIPTWLNEIVGGFQLAGLGEVRSQMFQPGAGNWGPISSIKIYKKSRPVRDCSSGVCYNNFLWWNGDLTPQQNPQDPNHMLIDPTTGKAPINPACETTSNCITGVPADFVPFQVPSHNVPNDPNYNSDKVNVKLLDNSIQSTPYDGGPGNTNFYSKTWLPGPYNWKADVSLFKVFPIRPGMFLRVNLDAFNVFNMPGETNPGNAIATSGTSGIESFTKNYYPARQLQASARFTF